MEQWRTRWTSPLWRGLAVVAVLLLAVAVVSPAFSAHSNAHVKKIAKKVATKVAKKHAYSKAQSDARFEPVRNDDYFSFLITGDGEKVIASGGGLSVAAKCDIEPTGTADTASLEIRTTVDNAAYDDNNGPEESDFDVALSPDELYSTSSDDSPEIEVTSSGSGVTGVAADRSIVAVNDYALGVNLAVTGTCFFSGHSATAKV